MDLRQLEYFMAVCKELHFSRAAEKLHISQPTLSQQIKSLEFKVGMPLFDRIGKKVALTEAGKILLSHSRRIFHEIEQAQLALNDLNGLERGKLTVGSLLTSVSYLLPSVILSFKEAYPNIDFQVLGMPSEDVRKGILENELDLGITFLPADDEEIETIPLFTEELSLAAPASHPLAKFKEVDLQALENTATILLPKNYCLRKLIDQYCAERGITLNPTLEMTTMEALIQIVADGIGVTILPAPYIDYLSSSRIVNVKLMNPTPQRDIGVIYRRDKFMCQATKTFIRKLLNRSRSLKKKQGA